MAIVIDFEDYRRLRKYRGRVVAGFRRPHEWETGAPWIAVGVDRAGVVRRSPYNTRQPSTEEAYRLLGI